ncbi:bis(5'-nucleosyl)-tetraphosphatase [Deinococcus phoenicis]|uniref:Bis(5'-nucleosyl)-tetraphosphatase n=1 Tax=Deinococcus phoenicis TaxID=1476583 RepID=A0A016QS64_9DEIO|nr:polynucleotide kinase-phosphatase [Deinococcus phoenicis]EYB68975.1 bis(5'-nucleosyl)-tetraphosphatase [Deinococcus phoenicis]
MTEIRLPELALVALVGASSAGKSTFAARHFEPTEVLSSDFFRALVSDDESSLEATGDAFDSLFFVAGKRLARGRLTVVDATSVRPDDRRRLVDLARQHDVLPVAIVLDLPRAVLEARHAARPDRDFRPDVIGRQVSELRRTLRGLQKEGFRHVWVLRSGEAVDAAQVSRVPLYTNRQELSGPFDFIGDVHGCLPELRDLLAKLGYTLGEGHATPPPGRTAVFVGDLVDRGPDSAGTLRLVMNMIRSGAALCVPGNHDEKLKRALDGKAVKALHGLDGTLAQLEEAGPEFRAEVRAFLAGLVSHLVLDGGRVVVAHAGLPERYQGRASGRVRSFALYGDVDGSQDERGLPVRRDWAADYRGQAYVVYGHTPVAQPHWVNRTLNIDTGCAFGGALTALRYPEMELVSVPAHAQYAVPARPLAPAGPEPDGEGLDLAAFLKGGRIETRTFGGILVKEGERAAAIETFSRFGVDPRWAVYLPPTMSPVETSSRAGFLEHPAEAFAYFRGQGLSQVVCEEKHMGSRAVLVLARDEAAARTRFGVPEGAGSIFTRTGRPFFQPDWEADVLTRARAAVTTAGLWETLDTGWLVLDAEILPWSLKAGELIRGQYAAVGAAGNAALPASVTALEAAAARGVDVAGLLDRTRERAQDLRAYRDAYRAYVHRVEGPHDVQIRPFHLLASEGQVHTERDHLWHLETLGRLADADPLLFGRTAYRLVTLGPVSGGMGASEAEAAAWWEALTAAGGEGMVVKPLAFLDPDRRSLQPAVKVRGREYLRIIYGPEYTRPENLARLRTRALGAKRARALREFHLGLEALARFVDHAGTARVHESVLGVLALESDPVDARL